MKTVQQLKVMDNSEMVEPQIHSALGEKPDTKYYMLYVLFHSYNFLKRKKEICREKIKI